MINVLFFETIYHLGGAERVTFDIVSRMNASKFRPILCTLYEPGPMGEVFKKENFLFYSNIAKSKYDIIGAFFGISIIIKKEKIDVIYLINQPMTLFWGYVIGKIFNIPIISVIHNTPLLKEALKLKIYKLLLPRIALTIAVSTSQEKHLIENEKIKANIIVISNGIDTEKFRPAPDPVQLRRKLGFPEKTVLVGTVARLVWLKGIDVFIKAIGILGPIADYYIIGDGPERSKLETLAKNIRCADFIHFLGARNDIESIVPLLDIGVLASRTEALPMSILEYLACGIASVVTDVGSISELICDGVTGFLVESENHVALAEKIGFLIRSPLIRKQIGAKAREDALNRYCIKKTVELTEQSICSVILKHTKTR